MTPSGAPKGCCSPPTHCSKTDPPRSGPRWPSTSTQRGVRAAPPRLHGPDPPRRARHDRRPARRGRAADRRGSGVWRTNRRARHRERPDVAAAGACPGPRRTGPAARHSRRGDPLVGRRSLARPRGRCRVAGPRRGTRRPRRRPQSPRHRRGPRYVARGPVLPVVGVHRRHGDRGGRAGRPGDLHTAAHRAGTDHRHLRRQRRAGLLRRQQRALGRDPRRRRWDAATTPAAGWARRSACTSDSERSLGSRDQLELAVLDADDAARRASRDSWPSTRTARHRYPAGAPAGHQGPATTPRSRSRTAP